MGQRNYQPRHLRDKAAKTFNSRKEIGDMYNYAWESYRKRFLAINHECYACGENATVVDHLKPHQGDEILFKKTDNHIPLCERCHNTVTMKFDKKYKPGYSMTPKIEWLNRKRIPGGKWEFKRVKVLTRYE